MNKKNLLLLYLFFLAGIAYGQSSLLFLNPQQGKLKTANYGDQLSIRYRGYLGQTEQYKNTLSEITDSSIILGFYMPDLKPGTTDKLGKLGLSHKEILLRDVVAFRRISPGRNLLKSSLSLGSALGAIFLLNSLYQSNQFSTGFKFGISLGIGLGTNFLINQLLPETPKYKMIDGWKVESVK